MERLHQEFQNKKVECENGAIKIRELNRLVDHQRERLQKAEQELSLTSKTLSLLRKTSSNKKQRMVNIYKSAFGAMKSEIQFIKKNVRGEIEILERVMKNTVEAIMMKLKETLVK